MTTSHDTAQRTAPFAVGRRRGAFHAFAAVLLAASVSLATLMPHTGSGTAITFKGTTSADLDVASNYSTGNLPTSSNDVRLTSSSLGLMLGTGSTAPSLPMQSLNVTNGSAYTIQNDTTGTGNSTLTLGNTSAFTDVISGNASDLIYVSSANSALSILGSNGSTGSGTLGVTLASSGNFDVAGTTVSLTISAAVSAANNSIGITKTGTGTLTLSGANTFAGGVSLAGGTLSVGSAETAGVSGPLGTGTISFTGGTLQFSTANTFDYSSRFSTVANQAYSVNTNGNPVTFASALTSSGGTFNKLGTGTLTLSGANTFSGGVTLTAGVVAVGSAENPGVSGPLGTMTAAGAINFAGGTLQYTAANQYDYSSRFSTAANQNVRINTNSQIVTFATPLTSSGGTLYKAGVGTLVLNDANTFSGAVTLNAGILSLGSAENPGVSGPLGTMTAAGAINFTGGSLQYTAANQYDYSSRFSTAANQAYIIATNGQSVTFASALTSSGGTLTKNSTGTLTLSGANTFSGGVTLTAGALSLGSAENPGVSGPLGTMTAAGAINFAGGTLQYTAANQYDYSSRFSTAASQTYNIGTNSQNVTFASALTSSGGTLNKLGLGTLTLSGANTFSGGVTLTLGNLSLGSAENPGVSGPLGTGTISFAGGTLQYTAANQYDYSSRFSTAANQAYSVNTNGNPVTFASALTSSGGTFNKLGTGTLTLSGANTFSGGVTLTLGNLSLGSAENPGVSGPLGTGTISFAGGTLQYTAANQYDYSSRFSTAANQAYSVNTNGNPVTFASALTSSGGTFNKLGTGTLTLSGANTFSGGVTLTAGALSLGSAENPGVSGPLGTMTAAGAINFAGGTLQYTAANQYDYSSRFSTAANQVYNIGTNSQIVTFATPLTSSGGTLTKSGFGTLVLNDANTFSGGVTINGGALSLGSAENPGVSGPLGTGTISFTNGALQFSANNTFDYSSRFSTAANQAYAFDTNGQNVTLASALTSASGSLTKTGALGFPPAGSQSGAGTLTVSGANTFSGPVNINGGILALGSAEGSGAGPLGNGSSTNVINFAGGTLQYSAVNQTDYSARFNTASTTQAYSVDTNSQNVTFASNLTSANGTFTKVGAGILTLTGANTYAGGTTVNGGVLQISNASGTSATGSGTVMVVAGAALRGTGYIDAGANTITVNGTLSPGSVTNSPGTITLGVNGSTGALTLASTSTLAFHISSVNSQDLVALSGSTALALNGGTLALVLPDTTATGIDYTATYPLFTGVGSLLGSGFGSVTGYDSTDYAASFALDGTEYDLSFVAVPEPSTMYAAALLAGCVVWHQRRRWSPAG